MSIWHDVDPSRITPTDFLAVIEISKGCKNKYELDKETGVLILDRVLHTSTHYPANYGFIPRTFSDDNDPLDVLVLCSEAIVPMAMVVGQQEYLYRTDRHPRWNHRVQLVGQRWRCQCHRRIVGVCPKLGVGWWCVELYR